MTFSVNTIFTREGYQLDLMAMSDEKVPFGWGFIVFLYIASVVSIVLFSEISFVQATAACTIVCAVLAFGAFLTQKFGEGIGGLFCIVAMPIAIICSFQWVN